MADLNEATRTILKNDPDFEGLDFAAMRAEGINYIAELSGKIWTDHNVHDPGITLLELLCYALLDLGYRTRLPAIDIFTPDPNAAADEDNFFTPGQILTCNPVTILDFRKLLMDIKEVKNAWLEINEDEPVCPPENFDGNVDFLLANANNNPECKTFLNGLYNVYIELYKGPETPENQWSKKEKERIETVVEKVRQVLMSHRNLCEDFVSVTVLCKEKIGVCADIELEPGADAEKIYVKVIETLRSFFSPAPKYYTLPQLLDLGKPIEEIFAGRPYLPESHGFIDTEELENIRLRKEIHVSDVYNALFSIPGIKTIRRLRLGACSGQNGNISDPACDWKYLLTENHTPEFSLDCSGFKFTRNGMSVSVNEKKYKDYFSLNFASSGKLLHQQQLPALDLSVPKGFYHANLAEHYSIQNDLPQVYGVKEGGIPDSASDKRKAQALQLKGFLLFFDQLFANYLAQLSQIRQLFSFRNGNNATATYFTGLPLQVSDFEKLQRFGGSEIGTTIQAKPVSKSLLDNLIAQDKLKETNIENDCEKLEFVSATDRDAAVYFLINDLQNRNYQIYTGKSKSNSWVFYLSTNSEQVALLSTTNYPDEKAARLAAENLANIGVFEANYYRFTNNNTGTSSFSIELKMAGYEGYLHQLAEDKTLYLERKKMFLDHLLSRFSESFTDFALLSFGTLAGDKLKEKDLVKKAGFLSSYDSLSRDRGKAYNYKTNGWNNNNFSGFEQRVKAYAGIGDSCGQSLCHFQVSEYVGKYFWEISVASKTFFKSISEFDSEDEAVADLKAFMSALKEEGSYKIKSLEGGYSWYIEHQNGEVIFPIFYRQPDEAEEAGSKFKQLLKGGLESGGVYLNRLVYRPQLINANNEVVFNARQEFDNHNKALSAAKPLVKKLDSDDWVKEPKIENLKGKSDLKASTFDPFKLVDLSAFTIKVKAHPEEYHWSLEDDSGEVIIFSSNSYKNKQTALESMLAELNQPSWKKDAFKIYKDSEGFKFNLVLEDGSVIGESPAFSDADSRNNARKNAMVFLQKSSGNSGQTLLKQKAKANKTTSDRYTFSVFAGDELLLQSAQKFQKSKEAKEHAAETLILAGNSGNYEYFKNPSTGEYEINLVNGDQVLAIVPGSFPEKQDANVAQNRVVEILKPNLYEVRVSGTQAGWKFSLQLGLGGASAHFQSSMEYKTEAEATEAYEQMITGMDQLELQKTEGLALLVSNPETGNQPVTATLVSEAGSDAENEAIEALGISQAIHKMIMARDENTLLKMVRKNSFSDRGNWVYRVVKADKYFAYHLDCTRTGVNSQSLEDLYHAVNKHLNYLQLWLGDDSILKRKNPVCGEYFYHYQLKARYVNLPEFAGDNAPVLLVSTKGYPSQTEAAKAFEENYLRILKRASKAFHYGEGKFISLTEPTGKNDAQCFRENQSVVYIPEETLGYFYNEAAAIATLVELAKSYPIRLSGKHRYKFSLYDYVNRVSYFISAANYDSPTAANEAFYFLLVLLKNPKNYYLHCDEDSGNQFIVLKEVLLESVQGVATADDAWDGINKLIGVSQTEEAYHIFQNPEDCCFSFFVACKSKLIHPCTYDTAKIRDKVLDRLYAEFSAFQFPEIPSIASSPDGQYYDLIYQGELVASLPVRSESNYKGYCAPEFLEFVEKLLQLKHWNIAKLGNGFQLLDEEFNELARLENPAITLEEWKTKLVEMAIRFPISRKGGFYHFHLPFSGSESETDTTVTDNCSCDQETPPETIDCSMAWESGCYGSCEEALEALQELPEKLKIKKNYRPVFDCECAAYRIEFIEEAAINAVNLQCYPTREMVCDAVEKVKKRINCEGLHLVEHILLRPRTDCPEHCQCLIPDCPDYDCRFIWDAAEEEDPCEDAANDPCFIPGQDPYSCIATVMLPAWAGRFRKQENRALIERILQREAPAHILLRILWVSPKALCSFETGYKAWLRWLANKKNLCGGTFDLCAFIELLFRSRLDCWWPEENCEPCRSENPEDNPCAELHSQVHRSGTCNLTVNDIYCWETPDCCYEYRRIILDPEQEKEKHALILNRTRQYRETLTHILRKFPEDRALNHAISIFNSADLKESDLTEIVKLLSVFPEEEEQAKAYKIALNTILNFYLDRSLLDQYDSRRLSDIKRIVREVPIPKLEVSTILQNWNTAELAGFVHGKTFEALRGIFNN